MWPYCVNTVDVLGFRRHKFPRTLQVFMEIQKFLVLFCRYESPRTRAHLCIFLPHLRTQRCVLIRFSRRKFPCTLPIMLTGCPECPGTFRCNWTLHSRITVAASRSGSTSVLTLPQFSLLRALLASFSPSFQGSW